MAWGGLRCDDQTVTMVFAKLKVISRVVAQFPSTLVLPLLLLGVLLSVEIPGILYFRHQLIHAREVKSQSLSDSVAASLQLQLQIVLTPVSSMETLIQSVPQWPALEKIVKPFGEVSVTVDDDMVLGLLPNGHAVLGFPLEFARNSTVKYADSLGDNNRERNLQTIQEGTSHHYPFLGVGAFAIFKPVYINGAAPNDTFGYPLPPTNCTVCYDPVKKRRFWGFVNAILRHQTIVEPRRRDLRQLHRYALVAPLDKNFANVTDVGILPQTATTIILRINRTSCMLLDGSTNLPHGSHTFKTDVKITDDYSWWLLVETSNADIEVFTNGLLAAFIAGTFVLCGMFFATLMSRRNHQLLLESLVPDSVIKQAQAQAGYLSVSPPILTAGSTADLMLQMVSDMAEGRLPAASDALTLRTAVLQRWDLYTPINLGKQLREGPLASDVAEALLTQLLGLPIARNPTLPKLNLSGANLAMGEARGAPDDAFNHLSTGLAALMSNFVVESRAISTLSGTSEESRLALGQNSIAVDQVLLDRAERALSLASSSWQFDAFELYEATNGYPLSTLGFFLMHQQKLISHYKLNATKLARFLQAVEAGYHHTNPYHNNTHAADVLQTVHMILVHGGLLAGGYVDELTMLGAYIAAIIHDYDHGGLTNDFLINTQDDIACQYNDRSPLENHHIAAAWSLLRACPMNFLGTSLSKSELNTLRKAIIELVLATDMKQHFSTVTVFSATVRASQPAKETAAAQTAGGLSNAEKLTVLQMVLKCADIGHTTADLPVHKRWLACLEEEFFKQGDKEAEMNLPISPLFDRNKPGASKSQVGFYNVVVLPMYSAFCSAFPAATPLLDGAKANFEYWTTAQRSGSA